MASTPLCSEEEIRALVDDFYARIRQDDQLGPIFNRHVHDWDAHLAKLADFWASVLLGARRFSGTPMPTHIALPGLNAALFTRWLALFRATLADQPNRALEREADAMAQRIASSLWLGYQLNHAPDRLPQPLTQ